MKQILAADIGGTSARFSRFELQPSGMGHSGLVHCDSLWLKTNEVNSFEELLNQLKERNFSLNIESADAAAIAIAGPVEEGIRAYPPNIKWSIDLNELKSKLRLPKTELLNDFVAQAWSICSPIGDLCELALPGKVVSINARTEVRGVIGAGTGLGKAIVVPGRNSIEPTRVLPSEGGHARLPIETPEEHDFLLWLHEEAGVSHVTYDEIVSGRGLSRIHEFLTGVKLSPAEISSNEAVNGESLAWFARFYGRVCRDFCLEVLPYGGLFIAGGIAAKVPALIRHSEFSREFYDCPSHHHTLERIQVFLNRNEESGIWGAGFRGMVLLQ